MTDQDRSQAATGAPDPTVFAALDGISDAVLVRDLAGVILHWNPVAVRRIGYTRDQAVGRLWNELLQTISDRPLEELEAEVRSHGTWRGNLTHIRSDGTVVAVRSRWLLLRDGAGQPVAVLQLNDEIERLEAALAERRQMEETQRAILDNSPMATVLFRTDLMLIHANLSAQKMFGRDPAGFGSVGLLSVVPEHERASAADLSAQRDATGYGRVEMDMLRADGSTFPAEVTSAVIAGSGGTPAIINYITDLTHRRHLERELRASAELQRAVLENSADAVMLWASEVSSDSERGAMLVQANDAACALFGAEMGQLRRVPVDALLDPAGAGFVEILKELRANGRAKGEVMLRKIDGSNFVGDVALASFTGPDGRPYTSVIIRDLTERHRAARALEDSEKRFRAIFHRAPLGIARVGLDLRIIESNLRLRELLSGGADLTGRRVTKFLTPEDLKIVTARFQEMIHSGADAAQADTNVRRDDGSTAWLHWTAAVFRKENGDLDQFLVLLEDVSARKAAEDSTERNLVELERISTLKSEFVGLVSHEFRTALTGIQGFSELIRDVELEPAEMREFAADINKDALRLNRMITEMLDLDRMEAGRFTLHKATMDINEAIEESVARARPMSAIHELVTDLESSLPSLEADRDRMIQVLTNLVNNAVKYSPAGGLVKVSSRSSRGSILISVKDQGEGIPADFLPKVFKRFERYEASATSRVIGTGLGLPIAHQIVEAHGGQMWVESKVGEGSTFHFTIPLATPV